jgi:hypothetical protein
MGTLNTDFTCSRLSNIFFSHSNLFAHAMACSHRIWEATDTRSRPQTMLSLPGERGAMTFLGPSLQMRIIAEKFLLQTAADPSSPH